jgi:hypothetical protein
MMNRGSGASAVAADRMECRLSKPLGYLTFVSGLPLLAASAFGIMQPGFGNRALGLTGILFFGLCDMVIFRGLISKKPLVILDEQGIMDSRLKIGKIYWRDIAQIYRSRRHSKDYLCIELSNRENFQRYSRELARCESDGKTLFNRPVILIRCQFLSKGSRDIIRFADRFWTAPQ